MEIGIQTATERKKNAIMPALYPNTHILKCDILCFGHIFKTEMSEIFSI